jgi:dihydropyrimidinase
VIFDPKKKHTLGVANHPMHMDFSAYEGWKITEKTKTVLLRDMWRLTAGM